MNEQAGRAASVGGNNSGIIITGDGNVIRLDAQGTAHPDHIATGLRHLRLGRYDKALEAFRRVLDSNPNDADAYYLSAVATLGGRKAFVTSLADIREAESLIQAAIRLEDRAVFHYFLAYLRSEYYERKFLRGPATSRSSLDRAWANGVQPEDVVELFTLLSVDNPLPVRR
jgi:tetratricopeptide (TPR) repeat protein